MNIGKIEAIVLYVVTKINRTNLHNTKQKFILYIMRWNWGVTENYIVAALLKLFNAFAIVVKMSSLPVSLCLATKKLGSL